MSHNSKESAFIAVKAYQKGLDSIRVPPINLENIDTVGYMMRSFPHLIVNSNSNNEQQQKEEKAYPDKED